MLITSIVLALLLSYFSLTQTSDHIDLNTSLLFNGIVIFNIVAALFVMALVFYRLNKSGGTSVEVKQQISRRYLEYVLFFVVLSYASNKQQKPELTLTTPDAKYIAGTHFATGWRIGICGFGIVMAISRLRDPLILKKL